MVYCLYRQLEWQNKGLPSTSVDTLTPKAVEQWLIDELSLWRWSRLKRVAGWHRLSSPFFFVCLFVFFLRKSTQKVWSWSKVNGVIVHAPSICRHHVNMLVMEVCYTLHTHTWWQNTCAHKSTNAWAHTHTVYVSMHTITNITTLVTWVKVSAHAAHRARAQCVLRRM